jgi:hypothetical protein
LALQCSPCSPQLAKSKPDFAGACSGHPCGSWAAPIQKLQMSMCLERAFDATGFPPPSDEVARSVRYHMAVDFAAMHQDMEDRFAAAGL